MVMRARVVLRIKQVEHGDDDDGEGEYGDHGEVDDDEEDEEDDDEEKEEDDDEVVHYCTLSLSDIWVTRQECRVGTPYMERNFIDSLPKAKVDQSEFSFLQKRHLGYVTGPK